jgi:hypothetical protein
VALEAVIAKLSGDVQPCLVMGLGRGGVPGVGSENGEATETPALEAVIAGSRAMFNPSS